MTNEEDFIEDYLSLIARAWHDRSFRERLRACPRDVLTEVGWPIPADAVVTTVTTRSLDIVGQVTAWREAPATGRYVLHLPLGAVQDLTDEQLESIVGGARAVLATLDRPTPRPELTVVNELPPVRP